MRASLLYCLFSIVGLSWANDDLMTVPACEGILPHDIYIALPNMGLDAIRNPFVNGSTVTCINLEGNQISHLENGSFDGLPELQYLNLARNPVSFEDFMNMNFPKLRTLVLDGPLPYGYENRDPLTAFYGRNYFHERQRSENISPISLPNLKKLSLCNFEERGISIWLNHMNAPNLTHLYLAGNSFTKPPEKFTQDLILLNMDDNKVNTFMENCPSLRYLSMDRNKIQTVCNSRCHDYHPSIRNEMSLYYVPKLEYLSLMGNEITTIESDAFANLDNLRILNLAMNKITDLSTLSFNDVARLENLTLSNNELTGIPEICALKKLEVLLLNGNQIRSIDDSSFCNLPRLNFIDLSNNHLTSILDGTFGQLSGLVALNLSWNNIEALPENWAGSDSNLNVLNLDGNSFTDVANMSLGLIRRLDRLSIGHNPLETITIRCLINLPQDIKIDVSREYKSKTNTY